MNHEHHENRGHDELAARISGWLSGELDPAVGRAVGRAVDRDPAARRIAAGYRRVDALARDWYDALPVRPEPRVAAPLPVVHRQSGRGLSAAALAAVLCVACTWRIDTVAACGRLWDAAGAALHDGDSPAILFEPTACWSLRDVAFEWATPGSAEARTAERRPRDADRPAPRPLTRS